MLQRYIRIKYLRQSIKHPQKHYSESILLQQTLCGLYSCSISKENHL